MLSICALASGSSGNAIYVESDGTKLLIDTGISARELTKRLSSLGVKPQELDGILITHEHGDHIRGLRVFTKNYHVPIYCTQNTWYYLAEQGVSERYQRIIHRDEVFEMDDLQIEAFPIPHDAVDPVGFCIANHTSKIGIATDLGHIPEYLRSKFRLAQLVFLEANHDVPMLTKGKYPQFLKERILGNRGHLSNDTAAAFIADLAEENLQKVVLGHLSKNNNTPEMAISAVQNRLENKSIKVDNVVIECCCHGELGRIISI